MVSGSVWGKEDYWIIWVSSGFLFGNSFQKCKYESIKKIYIYISSLRSELQTHLGAKSYYCITRYFTNHRQLALIYTLVNFVTSVLTVDHGSSKCPVPQTAFILIRLLRIQETSCILFCHTKSKNILKCHKHFIE